MANNNERRAVARLALREWRTLLVCLRDIQPGGDFYSVDSMRWGQGALQTYARLGGLREAAEVLGFRLDITDLEALDRDPRAPLHLIPEYARRDLASYGA